MTFKSNKIRKSAKGKECTLRIAGVCNYDCSTTVLAHLPDESHGIGLKSDDFSACYACSSCHDFIDNRVKSDLTESDRQFYMRRAQTRTIRSLVESGLLIYT